MARNIPDWKDFVKILADEAPPLTDEQKLVLRRLFRDKKDG